MEDIICYTDGSCDTKTGKGGWAYIIKRKNDEEIKQGRERIATNNRMELTAVCKALESILTRDIEKGILEDTLDVLVVSDSNYVVENINRERYIDWVTSGWKTKEGSTVANIDLWSRLLIIFLYLEAYSCSIEFRHVKSHNGHKENERVDKLAVKARKESICIKKLESQNKLNQETINALARPFDPEIDSQYENVDKMIDDLCKKDG